MNFALKRIFIDSKIADYLKLERRKIRNTIEKVLIPVKRDIVSKVITENKCYAISGDSTPLKNN